MITLKTTPPPHFVLALVSLNEALQEAKVWWSEVVEDRDEMSKGTEESTSPLSGTLTQRNSTCSMNSWTGPVHRLESKKASRSHALPSIC